MELTSIEDRIHPLDAIRGLWRLIRNEDDTKAVFVVVRAMAGKSIAKSFRRFRDSPMGVKILHEKRNLIKLTGNMKYLRSLPFNSFGYQYSRFMDEEEITADGLVSASDTGEQYGNPDFTRYYTRIRDSHDLQHVLTGYGRDGIGELCLVAFMYAQTRSLGLAFIAFIGSLSYARFVGVRRMYRAVMYAYRTGKQAYWLPKADWEYLLTCDLTSVKSQLSIRPTNYYTELLRRTA